jgi:hypothetical protein
MTDDWWHLIPNTHNVGSARSNLKSNLILWDFTSATPRNPLQRKPWHRLVTWHLDFGCHMHGSLSLGWGRTGDICYQYKNRDAYRFWYTCTVYYQFEKWITLVYTKFKTWDNLQRYELWKALHILCRIIWEFCIWSKTVHRLTSIYSVMLAMLCSMLCFRLLI